MITSLVLTDRYTIGIDSNERFLLGDTKVKTKEVPFIRYRFNDFVEADIAYIRKMMETFKYSAHLAEIVIKDGFEEQVLLLNDNFENLAIFLYLPVNNSHVESCELQEHDVELLRKIDRTMFYDRIMLKDCSDTLHLVSANKLKKQIADITGFKALEIGICNSPLSFGDDACLTAVRARALASKYVQTEECALPSANHECMNCCGCIRYHLIESNIAAPVTKVSGGSTSKTPKEPKEEKVKKEEDASNNSPKKKFSSKAMSAW